jgi:hypothetical protein
MMSCKNTPLIKWLWLEDSLLKIEVMCFEGLHGRNTTCSEKPAIWMCVKGLLNNRNHRATPQTKIDTSMMQPNDACVRKKN